MSIKMNSNNLLFGSSRAICYSGFREGQHPDRGEGAINPSYEETLEDLKILSRKGNFPLIRIYDSGENSETVLQVIRENKLPVKVLLGIWLKAEVSSHETCHWLDEPISETILQENRIENQREIERGIKLALEYSDVVGAVNVGNESLVDWNDHMVDPASVIGYVERVKAAIGQPVTVAENFKWWVDHGSDLAEAVDFISIHTYPAWTGYTIDEAMAVTIAETEMVARKYPHKQLVVTEAGWASEASEFGDRADEDSQARYYDELFQWAAESDITVFIFEAFDESWKGNPDNPKGAEKHWGLFTVDRKPKKAVSALYGDL